MSRSTSIALAAGAVVCLAAAIGLQIARDRRFGHEDREIEQILYVRSDAALKRLTLDFDALAADVYWIRAVQHFGGDRRKDPRLRKYELLLPLLEHTTTLDPYFSIAYRFGAIFLSEKYPGGAGRPDQAIGLLKKGIAAQPGKWQYYHDIAFVYYWHLRDFEAAALWFQRAGELPNSANWLKPLAAGMLSASNDRASARFLWNQILKSDEEWLRKTAVAQPQPAGCARRHRPAPGDRQAVPAAGGRAVFVGRPGPAWRPSRHSSGSGRHTIRN